MGIYRKYCDGGCGKLMYEEYGHAVPIIKSITCQDCLKTKGETMDIDDRIQYVFNAYLSQRSDHPNVVMLSKDDYDSLISYCSGRSSLPNAYISRGSVTLYRGCKVFVHPEPCRITCARIEIDERRDGEDRRG